LGKIRGVFGKAGGAATGTATKAADLAGGAAVQNPLAQKVGASLLAKTSGLQSAVDTAKKAADTIPQTGPGLFQNAQSALSMVSTAAFAAPAITSLIPKRSSGEEVVETLQEAGT